MKRFSPIIREQIIWWMWKNNLQLVHRQLNHLVRHYTINWLVCYYDQESCSFWRVLDDLDEDEVAYAYIIRNFLAIKPNFKNLEAWLQAKYVACDYSYENVLAELMESYTSLDDNRFIEALCSDACIEWKLRNFISFRHTKFSKRSNIFVSKAVHQYFECMYCIDKKCKHADYCSAGWNKLVGCTYCIDKN